MIKALSRGWCILTAAVLVAGCSKSSSPTGPSGSAPKLNAPTFSGPTSTSASADTSQGAQEAKSKAELFSATAQGFLGYYSGNATQSNNGWSWTYISGSFKATWTATSGSSGYNWKLVYNGTLGSATYTEWTALDGYESTDGKSGNWNIYYTNTTVVAYQVSWSTDASGVLTGTVVINDSTGTMAYKDVFTSRPDKSGELKEYIGTSLVWDVIWNSDGSGHYTEWDYTGATVVASGSWT